MSRTVNAGSRTQRRQMSKSPIRKKCNGKANRMRRLARKELGI